MAALRQDEVGQQGQDRAGGATGALGPAGGSPHVCGSQEAVLHAGSEGEPGEYFKQENEELWLELCWRTISRQQCGGWIRADRQDTRDLQEDFR